MSDTAAGTSAIPVLDETEATPETGEGARRDEAAILAEPKVTSKPASKPASSAGDEVAEDAARQAKAEAVAAGRALRHEPGRYVNRELSWLQFNRAGGAWKRPRIRPSAAGAAALPVDLGQQPRRVLHGAGRRPARPGPGGLTAPSADGLSPAEQLARIDAEVTGLAGDQQRRWSELREELHHHGIDLVEAMDLSAEEAAWLEDYSSSTSSRS